MDIDHFLEDTPWNPILGRVGIKSIKSQSCLADAHLRYTESLSLKAERAIDQPGYWRAEVIMTEGAHFLAGRSLGQGSRVAYIGTVRL